MRRYVILLAALLAFRLLPSAGTELSQLRPASLLCVSTQGKTIRVQTDTEDEGYGETLEAALQNMHASSLGVIRLDTVERLLLSEAALYLIPQLREQLRPTVRVCVAEGKMEPKSAGEYLLNHIPEKKLMDVAGRKDLQSLNYSEGRYILE